VVEVMITSYLKMMRDVVKKLMQRKGYTVVGIDKLL
tara:strand:- start:589 stop:696 length:108 start_codon:yes stop_codon:yes gene_type:complete